MAILGRRCAAGSLVLILATLVAGCSGDGDGDGGDPAPTTSAAAETSAPATPTEPTSQPTSQPTSEPVEPTGPRLAIAGVLEARLPAGWVRNPGDIESEDSGRSRSGTTHDQVSITTFPSFVDDVTLADIERAARRNPIWDRPPTIVGRMDVAGVPMVHVRGQRGTFAAEELETFRDGESVSITFVYDVSRDDPAERAAIVEQVLATVEWA